MAWCAGIGYGNAPLVAVLRVYSYRYRLDDECLESFCHAPNLRALAKAAAQRYRRQTNPQVIPRAAAPHTSALAPHWTDAIEAWVKVRDKLSFRQPTSYEEVMAMPLQYIVSHRGAVRAGHRKDK